jgi:hypothetical protein
MSDTPAETPLARAEVTLDAHRGIMETLRAALVPHFREAQGKKITMIDPAAGPDDAVHCVEFYPFFPAKPGAIEVRLARCRPRKGDPEPWINVVLYPIGLNPIGIKLHQSRHNFADVDAAHLCRITARFVEDPAGTVAAGGTHCALCQGPLTDPESIQRGVGSDCWTRFCRMANRLQA